MLEKQHQTVDNNTTDLPLVKRVLIKKAKVIMVHKYRNTNKNRRNPLELGNTMVSMIVAKMTAKVLTIKL